MITRTLKSTDLFGGKTVRKSELVNVINPNELEDSVKKGLQEDMNEALLKEIGKPPYTVLKIYPFSENSIMFRLEGEDGKIKKRVSTKYFKVYKEVMGES